MAEDLLEPATVSTDPPGADGDPPPEEEVAENAEYKRQSLELYREMRRKAAAVDHANEALKEAKAAHTTAVARLNAYLAEFDKPLPLWSKPAGPPPHEAWREVPIRQVLAGFPEKQLETLENHGLKTLEDFEKFRAARGEYDWGLPNIGPERRSKIEEQVLTWLGEYMANNPAPADESTEDADA